MSLGRALVGIVLGGGASAQCMQWDATVAIVPQGGYDEIYDLHAFTTGGQPTLYVAVNDAVRPWQLTGWAYNEGMGFNDSPRCLCTHDDGTGPTLYVGGYFTADSFGTSMTFLAKKVGPTWVEVPGLYNPYPYMNWGVLALESHDDGSGPALYVGGAFPYNTGGINSPNLMRWSGSTWSGVGGGIPPDAVSGYGWVQDLCSFDDGSGPALYVAGVFTSVGGIPTNSLAKWDGTSWTSFGAGLVYQGNLGGASALAVFDDGTGPALYVGGNFDHVGSVAANGIARWNGTTWSPLAGIPSTHPFIVYSLAAYDGGSGPELHIGAGAQIGQGGTNGVVRWDGQELHSLGGGASWAVFALASFDDGNGRGPALYAGGHTSVFGGNLQWVDLARWYGNCAHRIDPLCFGDGTFAVCPCSNYGASGRGCGNSANSGGALLDHTGTLSPDTLVLGTSFEPDASLTLFLQGPSLLPLQTAFGGGILCLEGPLLRLYTRSASGGVARAPGIGEPSISQRSAALGDPIASGSPRYYQAWYRDGASSCAPGSFNVTNGLRVVW